MTRSVSSLLTTLTRWPAQTLLRSAPAKPDPGPADRVETAAICARLAVRYSTLAHGASASITATLEDARLLLDMGARAHHPPPAPGRPSNRRQAAA
jgi:hypothetical protein